MVTYPSDWDVVELGSKCNITSSKRVFEREWAKSGIPFLRTRDIASFHSGEVQKDKLYISEETYQEKIASSGEPHKGDLLVTGVGTIGLPYLINTDAQIYFKDGNILWLKKSEAFFSQWLYLQFLSKEVQRQITDSSGFTTVGTFTIKNAKKLNMPMPPVPEQAAIARTLSQFDTYIDDLAELIEKKRGIRDGTLEDLMSCRTRIDGYSEDWYESDLSDICKAYDGTHQTPKYVSQGIRFISVENITNIYGSEKYISLSAYETDFKVYPEKGDILMTRIGDIGTPCVVETNEPLAYYVSLALFKNISIDSYFLNYYIKSSNFQRELDDRTLHHATPKKINKGEIGKCKVKYPKDADEQAAIADILRAMDEEIEALEIEQDKMIQIREGAMDDLLTGRVRLMIQEA